MFLFSASMPSKKEKKKIKPTQTNDNKTNNHKTAIITKNLSFHLNNANNAFPQFVRAKI